MIGCSTVSKDYELLIPVKKKCIQANQKVFKLDNP